MEQIHETTYSIKGLYDLEGDLAEGTIILSPEFDMIPKDPGFEDQDPDDEEFEGYTGNVSFQPSSPRNLRFIHYMQEGAPLTYCERLPTFLRSAQNLTLTPRVSSLRASHVPGRAGLENVITDGWHPLRAQETPQVEG